MEETLAKEQPQAPLLPLPSQMCDLVMKGGVVSGVVYPLAITRLARSFWFKNIGGTSAGAIAAAATAAAEFRRRSSGRTEESFEPLEQLSNEVRKPGWLLGLFKPQPGTEVAFRIATSALNEQRLSGQVMGIARSLVVSLPKSATVFAILAMAAIVLALRSDISWWVGSILALTSIAAAVLGQLVVACIFLYKTVTKTLPHNFYGLSRGYDDTIKLGDGPLVNWMTAFLNETAGMAGGGRPLTFGDLYDCPAAPGDPHETDWAGQFRSINLELMTTSVTHGCPFRLPFREGNDKLFYFREMDFLKLFPAHVVAHMKSKARSGKPTFWEEYELIPFPEARHLPVAVAARMSLSFPVLLSAVPLYAIDYTRKDRRDSDAVQHAERCWFTDGGVCSNLPIHFFDAPIPRWPSFAINLKGEHPDYKHEEDMVFQANRYGNANLQWTWRDPSNKRSLLTFLRGIVDTMQNWQENTQLRSPGYSDRIVHISLREHEGGLNLKMPETTVLHLVDRGQRAGELLASRFASSKPGAPADGWTSHRWVRFRSCMKLTTEWVRDLKRGYLPLPPDASLGTMFGSPPDWLPYKFEGDVATRAQEAMGELEPLWTSWSAGPIAFDVHPPRPLSELRIKPPI